MAPQENSEALECVRLDRWLFATRIFRTRNQAAQAVQGGTVKLNGEATKPHKPVRVGDEIQVRRQGRRFAYRVQSLVERRVGPGQVEGLFAFEEDPGLDENTKSMLRVVREMQAGTPKPKGRPTKRERRQLDKFRHPDLDPEED